MAYKEASSIDPIPNPVEEPIEDEPISEKSDIPNLDLYQVFLARPPYEINVNGEMKRIKLGTYGSGYDRERGFDLVQGMFHLSGGYSNAMSWQSIFPNGTTLDYVNVNDMSSIAPTLAGVPGRIVFQENRLKLAYLANDPTDGLSVAHCRVQINSWNVPTRQDLVWDLKFQLGSDLPGEEWMLSPPGTKSVLVWQLKAEPGHPTMAIIAETENESLGTIKLKFESRIQEQVAPNRSIIVGGLNRHQPIHVIIEGHLDERSEASGGKGFVKIWVNKKKVDDFKGQTLRSDFTADSHRWAFGVYMITEKYPVPYSRVTYWDRARMLVLKQP